jgi:hypothetical protein
MHNLVFIKLLTCVQTRSFGTTYIFNNGSVFKKGVFTTTFSHFIHMFLLVFYFVLKMLKEFYNHFTHSLLLKLLFIYKERLIIWT